MRLLRTLFGSSMLVALCASVASAATVNYTINSSQSVLTLTGNLNGLPFIAQETGTNAIGYTGTIKADRGASSIQFLSGSSITALTQTQEVEPNVDGHIFAPEPQPGNYGIKAPLGNVTDPDDTTTGYFGFYNLVLGATSASLPVSGTSFTSTGVTDLFSTGLYAYLQFGDVFNDIYTSGTPSLVGTSASNAGASGSVVTVGNVETLTLPVSMTIPFTNPDGIDGSFILSGNLVATATVPEPTMIAALALSLPALVRRRRKI